jgi:hypothetical protein
MHCAALPHSVVASASAHAEHAQPGPTHPPAHLTVHKLSANAAIGSFAAELHSKPFFRS